MRVLIDARTVGIEFSGVGNYALGLIRALLEIEAEHEFFLLVHGVSRLRSLPAHPRCTLVDVPCSHESHPLGDLWEEISLPRIAEKLRIDVVHGPAFFIPHRATRAAKVVSVHDLVAFSHAETVPHRYAVYMRWLIRRAVKRSQRIITGSESARVGLVEQLRASPDHIDVIPHGVAQRYSQVQPEDGRRLRAKLGLARPYLLFVGNLEPRKNLLGLLKAYRLVRERLAAPPDLVVAGKVGWLAGPLTEALGDEALRGTVHTIGYVEPDDLPALYGGSVAFVFPTFWEGFGLPILEAMASGTPVVTSNLSSLPEVTGDAGILVDPHSVEAIAQGILEVAGDEERRKELIARGRQRATEFSWERSAQATLETYAHAIREGR